MQLHPFAVMGQNIKQERVNQSLTQEQLSEQAGVSAVFLSQIENGRKVPSLETVYKIATCLGITLERAFKCDYVSTPNIDHRIERLLKDKNEDEKQMLFDIMDYISAKMVSKDS